MSLFNVFNVSGSAVSAQSQRLNVVASNLANADSVAGPDGQPYKARQVVFIRNWAANGTHSIKVVPVGTAGRPRIDIDAFVILR